MGIQVEKTYLFNLYKNTTLLTEHSRGKNESYLIYAVHVDKNWSDIKNKKEQETFQEKLMSFRILEYVPVSLKG